MSNTSRINTRRRIHITGDTTAGHRNGSSTTACRPVTNSGNRTRRHRSAASCNRRGAVYMTIKQIVREVILTPILTV